NALGVAGSSPGILLLARLGLIGGIVGASATAFSLGQQKFKDQLAALEEQQRRQGGPGERLPGAAGPFPAADAALLKQLGLNAPGFLQFDLGTGRADPLGIAAAAAAAGKTGGGRGGSARVNETANQIAELKKLIAEGQANFMEGVVDDLDK